MSVAGFFGMVAAMQAAEKQDYVGVSEYLVAVAASAVRHEYLGGLVYAMAGETLVHNRITGNLYLGARNHLKGKPCRVFMSDIRVNFLLRDGAYSRLWAALTRHADVAAEARLAIGT